MAKEPFLGGFTGCPFILKWSIDPVAFIVEMFGSASRAVRGVKQTSPRSSYLPLAAQRRKHVWWGVGFVPSSLRDEHVPLSLQLSCLASVVCDDETRRRSGLPAREPRASAYETLHITCCTTTHGDEACANTRLPKNA